MQQVPGRLERYAIKTDRGVFYAVIDYAHSSDGLEKVLSTLQGVCEGNLWALWGAGGDRTPVKRPIAGEVMARLADRVVVTTDNPRSESPDNIAKDVLAGVEKVRSDAKVILDRREAIRYALSNAEDGDIVLVAGKGPEKYMEVKGEKIPFLDAEEVLQWRAEHAAEAIS